MLEKDDIIGDYRLEKFLGRGQFGEVWLAEKNLQLSTRKVRHALKFLLASGDEIDLKAAEAEVDTWIEAGGHPNVMSVIDMLTHKGRVIIASEYAEGGSLKGWLQKNKNRAPSPEKAAEMMIGILRGIEHLHSRKVVHRDLKPDNILLQGEFPRITDFGISRIVSEGTMSTNAMGSPAYMSPESFNGNKSPQTDIWSAGVILYEMLTGTFPFTHETIYGLVGAIQQNEMKPLPADSPQPLRQIVEKALQKDRARRFQTAQEMRLAIESAAYSLRAQTDSENELKKIPFKTSVGKTESDTLPDIVAPQKTVPSPPPIVKTQPAPPVATEENIVEKTRDWNEFQSGREAELNDISAIKRDPAGGNKKTLIAIGGAVLGLLLISGLALSLAGNFFSVTNQTDEKRALVPEANIPSLKSSPAPPSGMIYVPGGEFAMGRNDGKSEAEMPAHPVSVKPFFIDAYEVTVKKYANPDNNSPSLPKVGVNWEQADAFCKKVGKRLPTEEEWEFAARGKENFIYPWGNDWRQGSANVGTLAFTEVGKSKGASPFGVYDMSGNAWEWTSSDFKAYPGGKLPAAFVGKPNLKTIRGGSYETTKDYATTTYRIGWAATGAINYDQTGFRCVQDINK